MFEQSNISKLCSIVIWNTESNLDTRINDRIQLGMAELEWVNYGNGEF